VQLAVDRLPDGEVSPYLVEDVMVGDQLELRGLLGGWFIWKPEQPEPVQLIAGGSGVVPLVAMVRAHRAAKSTADFRLLYSGRSCGERMSAARTPEAADTGGRVPRHSSGIARGPARSTST
jgi:ferredoxin-NADP reductase